MQALLGGVAVAAQLAAQPLHLALHRLELVQVLHGFHTAERGAQVAGEAVDDDHGAEDRVDDGTKVFLHKGRGAGARRVDKDEAAIVVAELHQAVRDERGALGVEEIDELVDTRWWDIALDKDEIEAARWCQQIWVRLQFRHAALKINSWHSLVKDFCGKIVLSGKRHTRCC